MTAGRPTRLAVTLLVGVVTACGPGDRIYVDAGGSATFEDREYLAIDVDRIRLENAPLVEAGVVTATNLAVADKRAYGIAAIALQRAIALRLDDGRAIALVPSDSLAAGRPLGATLPELCPFAADPVSDGCPATGS